MLNFFLDIYLYNIDIDLKFFDPFGYKSMKDSNISPIDEYLKNLPEERRIVLSGLRKIIKETAPHVVETMQYKMPTYILNDEFLCALASQKHYISLYTDVDIVNKYRDRLSHLNIGKSCIRFKKADELPLDTVKNILSDVINKQKSLL